MDRILWKILMAIWIRRAKRNYCPRGEMGEAFDTASFESAVKKTTGYSPGSGAVLSWLTEYGLSWGYDGCHWLRSKPPQPRRKNQGEK